MPPTTVPAPPEVFNFAQHLLTANAGRHSKAAFIDDLGTLAYGELDERVRRIAAGLRGLGLRREERVLLVMQDCNDWPVAFLGAMYAGVVPVAVNTLLTADDYAYMLEHSRAQAVRSPPHRREQQQSYDRTRAKRKCRSHRQERRQRPIPRLHGPARKQPESDGETGAGDGILKNKIPDPRVPLRQREEAQVRQEHQARAPPGYTAPDGTRQPKDCQ